MKKYLLLLLFLLVAVALYLYYGREQMLSLSDFKRELNSSNAIAVVMDTRGSPSTSPVLQCGVYITGALEMIGRSPKKFAYDGELCSYSESGASSAVLNASVKECESMLAGSTVFYIRYNGVKNSTSLYKSRAVVEGDRDFLLDCAISRLIVS